MARSNLVRLIPTHLSESASRLGSCSLSRLLSSPSHQHPPPPQEEIPHKDLKGEAETKHKETNKEEEEEEGEGGGGYVNTETGEVGGPRGPEPTRYGDWERNGRCSDF